MNLLEGEAREILDATHRAWSVMDLEGTLQWYADDLTYTCNTGDVDGGLLTIKGKKQFRDFLKPVMEALDSVSSIKSFKLVDEKGRASIDCTLRHRKTNLAMTGAYVQLVTYDRGKIARLEEIHDTARMQAFWQLVLTEEEEPTASIFQGSPSTEQSSWTQQLPWKTPKA